MYKGGRKRLEFLLCQFSERVFLYLPAIAKAEAEGGLLGRLY